MKIWVLISGLAFLFLAFGFEVYTYFQQAWLMQVAGNIPACEALAYIDSGLWTLPVMYVLSTVLIVFGLVIPKNADLNKCDISFNGLQIKTKRTKKKK